MEVATFGLTNAAVTYLPPRFFKVVSFFGGVLKIYVGSRRFPNRSHKSRAGCLLRLQATLSGWFKGELKQAHFLAVQDFENPFIQFGHSGIVHSE